MQKLIQMHTVEYTQIDILAQGAALKVSLLSIHTNDSDILRWHWKQNVVVSKDS